MMLLLIPVVSALSLEDAWAAAERQSHEAAIIDETRVQSDQVKTQAWAALSPKLSLGANWTLNQREVAFDMSEAFPEDMLDLIETFTGEPFDPGDPLVIQKKSYFDWNISVVQPLFSGRALPALVGATALVKAGEAQQKAGLSQLRLGVAQAWWGALVANEAEAVSTASVTVAQKQVDTAAALVRAGSATRQTELQARIGLARAERDLLGARAMRVKAEEQLAALTQLRDVEMDEPALRTLPYSSVTDAEARAADRSASLTNARQNLKASEAMRLASQLGWLPDINARFTEAFSENTGFSGENYTWMLTVGATWTLWDGGFRIADNNKSASQARLANEAVAKLESDTRVAIRGAWEDRARAQKALLTAQDELGFAQENLRLAEASFAAGASSALDTDQARLGLDAAKMSVIRERMSVDLATLQLLALTGDL